MKFSSNPAYSFGSSQRKFFNKNNPGPGQYERKNRFSHKGFCGQKEKRFRLTEQVMDPGLYSVKKNEKVQGYYFAKKVDLLKNTVTGIGIQYINPNQQYNKQQGKILKGKRFPNLKNGIPGPGQYNISLKNKSKLFLSKSKRFVNTKENQPGPGQYYTLQKNKLKQKFAKDKRFNKINNFNDPGQYNLIGQFNQLNRQKSKTGFSFGNQKKLNQQGKILDTIYDVDKYWNRQNYDKKFGILSKDKKFNDKQQFPNLGPGSYNLQQKQKLKSVINQQQKRFKNQTNQLSPTRYSVQKNLMDQKMGKMGKDKKLRFNPNKNPSPGKYNLSKKNKYRNYFGKATRDSLNNKNPGPGQYINQFKDKTKLGKFDVSQRMSSINKNPGPGQYDIKSTIPDVAKYLLN